MRDACPRPPDGKASGFSPFARGVSPTPTPRRVPGTIRACLLAAFLPASAASSEWYVFQKDLPMDDIVFHLAMGFAMPDGDDIRALIVQCAASDRHAVEYTELVEIDLDLFGADDGDRPVVVPGGVDSRHQFRVRWDEEPATALPFRVGQGANTLFLPTDRMELNEDFVRRVMAHDRLLVEVDSVGILDFPLEGATKAIREIRRLCSE